MPARSPWCDGRTWSGESMTTTKRKVSVSLDEDLVAELEEGDDTLSAQVDEDDPVELGRRRQQRHLIAMLDELESVHGPADRSWSGSPRTCSGESSPRPRCRGLVQPGSPTRPPFPRGPAALEAARRLGRDVVTTGLILAELYRGPGHSQVVDSCLGGSRGCWFATPTARSHISLGGVLTAAGTGSSDLADTSVVAAASRSCRRRSIPRLP